MASPNAWPAAFSLTGPDILALANNWMSGNVLWVDSSAAAASDTNSGLEAELPKATWTSAYAAATAGDLILCRPNHAETISVANVLSTANVTTMGMGIGAARARFTSTVVGAMWTVNVTGLEFHSLYFPASTAATTARISIAAGGTDCLVRGCYFEAGTNDATSCLTITGARAYIRDCDFVVTASRPARAILLNGAVASCRFEDILIDGSSYGFSSAAFGITAAATLINMENVRLANKADFVATTTGATYKCFGLRPIDSGGSRVVIAA